MRRRAAAAALAAAVLAAAPAARAQPAGPAAPAEDKKAIARDKFRQAKELHEKKQYAEAAALYLEAYRHLPEPAFLYNAGQVYRLGGEKAKALEHYRKYLELAPDGEGATDARQFIAELEAAIAADQAARAPAPPAGEGAAPPAASGPAEGGNQRPGRSLVLAGVVSGGIGAAALAASVVFALKASAADGDLDGYRGVWTAEQADLYASGQAAERNMKVSLVVGAAALAAGGTLFFLGRRKARAAGSAPSLGAAASGEGAVLLLGGSF